jgi:flagellar hook protein FlgE
MGSGVRLGHIKTIMTQGDLTRTDNITDLAINGGGFFTVETPFGRGFSRDGSFHFDKNGVLVNGDGNNIMGFAANEEGEIVNKLSAIQVKPGTIPAKATTGVEIDMNLDVRAPVKQFDVNDPDNTSNYSTSLTIHDSVGTPRLITMYYNKLENGSWEYHATVDGKDAKDGEVGKIYEMASGKLNFNEDGILEEEVEDKNSFNFADGATPEQKIKFSFGETLKEGGDGSKASTNFGAASTTARHTQDGFAAATLTSLSFNDDGILTAIYDNGEAMDVAQIAVAKFENNEGLFKMGKNMFKESKDSGQAAVGKPGEGGRGEVLSQSIEVSNVDLANEFVNLMTGQRNFAANAKTLTTADQMLQEVLNIKR